MRRRTGRMALIGALVGSALATTAGPAAAGLAPGCAPSARADFSRVQLYRDANCAGPSVIVNKTGDANRPNFAAFKNFDGSTRGVDNTRSSLAIDRGTCVRFYDGVNYSGLQSTNICAPNGVVFWNLDRFDDRATSMKVCTTATPNACGPASAPAPAPAPAPRPAPAPAPAPAPSGNTIQDKAVAWALSRAGTRTCQGEQPGWVKATFPRGALSSCRTAWCGIFVRQAYRAAGVELGGIASVDTIYTNARDGKARMRLIPLAQVRRGDLVLQWYHRDGNQRGRTANHVGIATGSFANNQIPTVEGNFSSKVLVTTRDTTRRDPRTPSKMSIVAGVRIG